MVAAVLLVAVKLLLPFLAAFRRFSKSVGTLLKGPEIIGSSLRGGEGPEIIFLDKCHKADCLKRLSIKFRILILMLTFKTSSQYKKLIAGLNCFDTWRVVAGYLELYPES